MKKIIRKIKCLFGRHKYNYQLGRWASGTYQDIYLTCDWCEKNFLKINHEDIHN